MQNDLNPDYSECQRDEEEVLDSEEEKQRRSSREAFLKLAVNFLRIMKQEELADCLQSKSPDPLCENTFKCNLKKKFQCVSEGIAKPGTRTTLNEIYTELYISEGGTGEVNTEHEDKKFSLVGFIHHFFTEIKEAGICNFKKFKVVFIFDGLDECRLPLNFHITEILTDVTESTSVDVLLTNLIRGKLLPSAHIWITTRPAAANQIPAEYVDMVTEVRGFTNQQKEEYFRKRLRDKEEANTIISHIKTSRSLHIMCHIPIFCWITATVLESVLKTKQAGGKLPKTLTEMYIHFLVVQTKLKNIKYDGGAETDPLWSPESRKMIEALGKLAFEQLQKGNLIFYESDLTECGINVKEASVYSGVFTQVFKEERGLYQDKVYCFVHLSIQEFLAALHAHLTFINSGINLLEEEQISSVQTYEFPWSALLFILLSSETGVDVFDLRKYSVSEEALLQLLPVVKACKKAQLSGCNLTERSCEALSSILISQSSRLRELDMSNNNLQDSGVKLLCVGLGSPHCMLETLRLSGCQITGTGFTSLATALRSNPSYLKELDLSYNHPGDSEMKLLSALKEDPHVTLDILWKHSKLSDDNKEVRYMEEDQLYPDHDLRFDHWPQLLCTNSLSGRCYWEVEWRGEVHVAVTYGGIRRKGEEDESRFGRTYQSWSLYCSDKRGYYGNHDYVGRAIPLLPSAHSHKVAVYVDCSAGTVSF
ncbi:unnamed protein product [Oreochromis niloticus]|nr:unnamed protein product [Mustela putorius furo]